MFKTILAAIAAVSISACASAPSNEPSPPSSQPIVETDLGDADGAIFANLAGGGVVHLQSQAECPTSFAGFDFMSTATYADDGTDVACQYENAEGTFVTLYITRFADRFDAEEHAADAAKQVRMRWPAIVLNEDASETCSYAIDLKSGMAQALISDAEGKDSEIEVGVTPCYIFEIGEGLTAVAVKVVMQWHLKIRVTGPGDEDAADAIVETISTMLFALEANVSGADNSDLESIIDDLIEEETEKQKNGIST